MVEMTPLKPPISFNLWGRQIIAKGFISFSCKTHPPFVLFKYIMDLNKK